MTAQRRHALEEMKKRGERQAVKSRLAYFVFQKLLNHFGSAHKATIAACVEAYFVCFAAPPGLSGGRGSLCRLFLGATS